MSWHCFGQAHIKAKKPHQCMLCGREIETGTIYINRTGVADGEFVVMKMHPDCESQTHDWDETDWETFSPGDLQTWINQE